MHQQPTSFGNIMEKNEIAFNEQFLLFAQCFLLNQILISPFDYFSAPLAVGQRANVMARCPSCVCLSVHPCVNFSLNIFSETTYQILMKFHRNVPPMVLLRFL